MYFSNIPNLEYDLKPIQYPFSNSDFIVAKNFFRRYQVNPDIFSYSVFFKKYSVQDGERLDSIAEKAYEDPFLDWVIVITNNIINPLFALPLSEYDLRKHCEKEYDDPYATIKHYKTLDLINSQDYPIVKGGLIVDESFYNNTFVYNDSGNLIYVPGSSVCTPVTIFEYEQELNEKKREIWILKPQYLQGFLLDFQKSNLYKECSDYVSRKLKKTGV